MLCSYITPRAVGHVYGIGFPSYGGASAPPLLYCTSIVNVLRSVKSE